MPAPVLTDAERERFLRFPAQIPRADLNAFFTLSASDRKQVPRTATASNRVGFALQWCALRYLGFCPEDLSTVPAAALQYVADHHRDAPLPRAGAAARLRARRDLRRGRRGGCRRSRDDARRLPSAPLARSAPAPRVPLRPLWPRRSGEPLPLRPEDARVRTGRDHRSRAAPVHRSAPRPRRRGGARPSRHARPRRRRIRPTLGRAPVLRAARAGRGAQLARGRPRHVPACFATVSFHDLGGAARMSWRVPAACSEHATKRPSARSQQPARLSDPDGARESLCSRTFSHLAETQHLPNLYRLRLGFDNTTRP